MLVSSNNLLNILLPNDNKVLKDVLKNADTQTLENFKQGSTSVKDILNNLFVDLKSGDKNNTNIENILKNSSMFKELGSFTKSLTTLLNQIESDSNLTKYKPILQNFLKDIASLDDQSLKELISKSGVFLESKTLEQIKGTTNLPKELENILNQIKTAVKDIQTLDSKEVETLIDKILLNNSKQATNSVLNQNQSLNTQTQTSNDLKTLITQLQNISNNLVDKQLMNLTTLTDSLKNISNQAQLVESKINNTPQNNNQIQQSNIGQNIQLDNKLLETKQSINIKTIDTLTQLKSELLTNQNIPNSQNIVKQIDNILQSNDVFSKNSALIEPKNLISQLTNLTEVKIASNQNPNIASLVSNLTNQSENISTLESKVFQNQNIINEKLELTKDIQQTLNSFKNEILSIKNIDTKLINQIIDKLLNLQNIFTKIELPLDMKNMQQTILNNPSFLSSFESNFSSNINNLILSLKENIINLSSNQNNLNLQQNIIKGLEKLENIINSIIQNPNILADKQLPSNSIQNDMKAVLLQMQNELVSKTDVGSQETIKQLEKMVTQVEYHQLLSLVSNSNNVYIPFIWDMLDDGSISMKKGDEEKFYCEINLSLKEFGQTQLLLALYDKNRLDLTIYASKDSFKKSIRENFIKLKQALNAVDLIPVNINIIDLKKEENNQEVEQKNAYKQNSNIGFGLDIRA